MSTVDFFRTETPSLRQYARQIRIAVPLVLLFGTLAVGSAMAQDMQVPFDRDSTLYTLDPDLRDQLQLLPEISGFQGAELYQSDSTTYELVIRYRENGVTRRARRTLSAPEVASFRKKITRARSTTAENRAFTQAGRYDLIAATTAHGFTEGALLAAAAGADGEEAFALPSLGVTLGFFAPLLATRKARVTEAEADMAFYGGLQGYAHGVQLTQVLAGGELDGRAAAGIAAVAGAIEGTVAYRVARSNNWRGGHSEMIFFNGAMGNFIGAGIGGAVVGEEGYSRVLAGTSFLGSLGGAYVGHRLGRTGRYTEGDARVFLQSSILAAYLTTSVLVELEDVSTRTVSGLLTGSAIGGAMLGRRLVRNRDFTRIQSSIVGLGGLAGGLSGSAVGRLLDTDEGENFEFTIVEEALGAVVGFGIAYAVLQGDARRQAAAKSSAFDLNVHVAPTMARGPATGGSGEIVPQVALTASF